MGLDMLKYNEIVLEPEIAVLVGLKLMLPNDPGVVA